MKNKRGPLQGLEEVLCHWFVDTGLVTPLDSTTTTATAKAAAATPNHPFLSINSLRVKMGAEKLSTTFPESNKEVHWSF